MPSAVPKVAILGGGIAGGTVAVALKTARVNAEITVVDRNFEYEPPDSLLDVLYGLKKPESVSLSTLPAYQKLGVQTLRAEVLRVDGDKRSVYTSARTFTPDYIVIALGVEPDPKPFEGAHSLPSLASLRELATLAENLRTSPASDYLIIYPDTDSHLYFFPLEVAVALRSLLSRSQKGRKARIRILSPEPRPFSRWDSRLSDAISTFLAKKEIEWVGQMEPASVSGNTIVTRLGADIHFETALLVPPIRSPRLFQNSPMLDACGWLQANPYLFNSRGDKVYAIGGCAGFILPSSTKSDRPLILPKWPQNAYDQAVILADNLAKEWKRDIKLVRYSGSAESGFRIGPNAYATVSGAFYTPDPPKVSAKFPGLIPLGARAPAIPDLRKILQ
ncbi:MAG: NAD(P)/FAD-dependent oxidoreductase [bacterium JZ-2024 1]